MPARRTPPNADTGNGRSDLRDLRSTRSNPAPHQRSADRFALGGVVLVLGLLVLVGGLGPFGLGASASGASTGSASAATNSPASLLASAHASAARGQGPWGLVAAPTSARTPMAGPNLTFGVIMTYDSADGYVLAVSLNDTGGPYNNTYGPTDLTWKFSSGNWSLLSTTGQVPATLSPGLVFDAHDGYVLLYGGRLMATGAPVAPITNQTWSYRAGVWSNLSATSTPAPFSVDFANPVYDAADEYVLLFDEFAISPTNPNGFYNTTWTYAGGTWTNITTTAGTPPQWLGGMAYDAADQYVVYFGGYTWWNTLTNETWTFHGGTWNNVTANVTGAPSPRMNFGIDYDSLARQVVLYGGLAHLYVTNASAFSYETWGYSGGAWTLLSSNGTVWSIQSMVYDAADNESVLLGSNSSLSVAPNVVTWTYSGGTWSVAAPIFLRGNWVTDVGRAVTLQVSQSPNGGGTVYRYAGLPPGCSSANTANLVCVPSSAGSYPVSVTVTGAGGFYASSQGSLLVNPAPIVLGFSSSGSVGEVGIALELQVNASLGTGALSYGYLGLPPGCSSQDVAVLDCVPATAGSYNVSVTVTDTVGATTAATSALRVVGALTVGSFAANRTTFDVGQGFSLSTTYVGGEGPFAFSYGGLPAGCGSVDASSLACSAGATGTFPTSVRVTDSLGAAAQSSTEIVVNPLPTVTGFVPSSRTVAIDGSVSIALTVAGGTAPFAYRYGGLPSGCAGTDLPVVSCSNLTAGNYSVDVTVVDATGASATGAATFTVLAAPAKIVLPPGPTSSAPGFWLGFELTAAALVAAAAIGGYRLYLARQGREIVRAMRAPDEPMGHGPDRERTSDEGSTGKGR